MPADLEKLTYADWQMLYLVLDDYIAGEENERQREFAARVRGKIGRKLGPKRSAALRLRAGNAVALASVLAESTGN